MLSDIIYINIKLVIFSIVMFNKLYNTQDLNNNSLYLTPINRLFIIFIIIYLMYSNSNFISLNIEKNEYFSNIIILMYVNIFLFTYLILLIIYSISDLYNIIDSLLDVLQYNFRHNLNYELICRLETVDNVTLYIKNIKHLKNFNNVSKDNDLKKNNNLCYLNIRLLLTEEYNSIVEYFRYTKYVKITKKQSKKIYDNMIYNIKYNGFYEITHIVNYTHKYRKILDTFFITDITDMILDYI